MKRILVVDDDEQMQRAIKRSAEDAGYEVLQAFDGAPALVIAADTNPDLIVLDINMPTDGRDVLHRLKQDPKTASIPVLIFSSRSEQHDRHTAFDLGAEEFIEKPVDARSLVRTIGRLIERART